MAAGSDFSFKNESTNRKKGESRLKGRELPSTIEEEQKMGG